MTACFPRRKSQKSRSGSLSTGEFVSDSLRELFDGEEKCYGDSSSDTRFCCEMGI